MADYYWPVMVINLAKARAVWQKLTRILSREGAATRLSGFLFKAVVQLVLIFGEEKWVVTPRMGRVLWGYNTR